MGKSRVSIFDDGIDISLVEFSPKKNTGKDSPTKEQIKQVSQTAKFLSREPSGNENVAEKRQQRRYRTGRNVQLNVKVSQKTLDAFYAISDQKEWVLGETLEHAVAALQREHSTKPVRNNK